MNNFKGSIYMVFDYMDHDLTGLMQRRGNKFEVKHVRVPARSPACPALSRGDYHDMQHVRMRCHLPGCSLQLQQLLPASLPAAMASRRRVCR